MNPQKCLICYETIQFEHNDGMVDHIKFHLQGLTWVELNRLLTNNFLTQLEICDSCEQEKPSNQLEKLDHFDKEIGSIKFNMCKECIAKESE
jgi:hypothetical protein